MLKLFDFAYRYIDDLQMVNCAALTTNFHEIQQAEHDLESIGVKFKRSDIPQHKPTTLYRILVSHLDTLRLSNFKKRYYHAP